MFEKEKGGEFFKKKKSIGEEIIKGIFVGKRIPRSKIEDRSDPK